MLQFNPRKELCTGCGACYSICPIKCISMEKDEEGFLYPFAANTCIHCGACERVCPAYHKNGPVIVKQQIAFAAISKRYDVWKRSSSGGAFSEICEAWGDRETYVYGAIWEKLKVRHAGIKDVNNIYPICKSKYIFSEIGECFVEAKSQLERGNKVIFTGTPCQIAGFKKYLNREYDNLFLIDLICHGVGSPKVFEACINTMQRQYGKEISAYEFRSKRKKYERDYLNAITVKDDKKTMYVVNDAYMQLFLGQDCLRPSCGSNCMYRTAKREGDVTLGDFKGLNQVFPQLLGTKSNYSTIIFNTQKGTSILGNLAEKMELLSCEVEDIKKYNPLFYRSTSPSFNRNLFFDDFIKSSDEAIKKWTMPTQVYKRNLVRIIYDISPVFVRKSALKINFFIKDKIKHNGK